MKEVSVICAEAFSNQAHKGNPDGIVFDADCLSELQMQRIAYEIGFNETVFILESQMADINLQIEQGQEIGRDGLVKVSASMKDTDTNQQ